jgi:4-alpha-glucanotransferase
MERRLLRTLARSYGISTTYKDVWRKRRPAADESLLATLRLLGAPVDGMSDVAGALRRRRQECWQTVVEPVLVAWEGLPVRVPLRLPEQASAAAFRWRLEFEGGGGKESAGRLDALPSGRRRRVEGAEYVMKFLDLPKGMPRGYHRLSLEFAGRRAECLVIAAPFEACSETPTSRRLLWGVFMPLYALHRASSWGAGDFADLEALTRWTALQGGSLVATLPLLAALWELSDDPSPYNPASRFFWNEFYLDPWQIPEVAASPAAKALLERVPRDAATLARQQSRLVDYAGLMAAKRRVLEVLADAFFAAPSPRRDALADLCRANPELESFARFRAVGERQRRFWPDWPEPLESGTIRPGDCDERLFRYHLYTQWQVQEQLRTMTDRAGGMDLLWYLDFPLGVSGKGYDVWRHRELFVRGAAGGAPPDSFFTKGQNWGFPPMHPVALRRQGYRYLIDALRAHLQYAKVLRVDHVMGLHRLYWIPSGFEPSDGVYVRYPMEELLAVLTLESHRFGARIVGENLGTVPKAVDDALDRHRIDRMYVLQYETNPDKGDSLEPVEPAAVASINTHDMPMFAAYWNALDVEDRLDMGLLSRAEAEEERLRRAKLRDHLVAFLRAEGLLAGPEPEAADVLQACQSYLARSPARIVLVNLEDLWGETEPQNRPGTYREYPNWRRKAQHPFEVFRDMAAVRQVLAAVDALRERAEAQ